MLGIPFYLADPKLQKIEKAVDALENERQIMMYMRHEAGHVFNYAYRLYTTPEWRDLFGPFFRTYRDDYRPVPFSKHFVRHIEGWYAQKHPDEDFAETFAVWLTPRSPWRRQYKGWPAIRKLRYVERFARTLADVEPIVKTGEVDHHAGRHQRDRRAVLRAGGPGAAGADRHRARRAPGADFSDPPPKGIQAGRRSSSASTASELVEKITYWTGVRRPIVRALDRLGLPDVRANEAVGRGW